MWNISSLEIAFGTVWPLVTWPVLNDKKMSTLHPNVQLPYQLDSIIHYIYVEDCNKWLNYLEKKISLFFQRWRLGSCRWACCAPATRRTWRMRNPWPSSRMRKRSLWGAPLSYDAVSLGNNHHGPCPSPWATAMLTNKPALNACYMYFKGNEEKCYILSILIVVWF